MRHNKISALCRQMVAKALGIFEDDIEIMPWDHIIYDFAKEHDISHESDEQLMEKFQSKVNQHLAENPEVFGQYSEQRQRHHDHFVGIQRKHGDDLTPYDEFNLAIAIHMEEKGLAKPLPD